MVRPNRRGTGKNEGPKKRGPAGDGDVQQEEPAASGPEGVPAGPTDPPRRPRLYGYDPDLWPEPN